MDEQLRLLIELQEVDGKIRALTAEKERLPQVLADLDRKLAASTQDREAVRQALQEAQKKKRDRDRDLEEGGGKVEKLKSRASEIKTNKEYQALLKEIEAAEQENKIVEDDILALMEQIDTATTRLAEAEKQTKEDEVTVSAERSRHEAAFARLGEELKGLRKTREEAASRIGKNLLAQYQRLLNSKAGTAIVEARGEACSGCYMSIPPQVFVNVKKNDSIITCPQCGRILYYKG